jgi:xanthine dehydrogenase iron-sulfur cluster and FAD-binding subunit A
MSLILNDEIVKISAASPEMPLLDFIRNQRGLTAAKPGCGTGDCGSCLVLAR